MRRGILAALVLLTVCLAGCHKKRTLANFGLKAGMTKEQVQDQMGSPAKEASSWLSYTMDDGNELRLFFLAGPRTGTRTLSRADLYIGEGTSRTVTNVFLLPPTSRPSTEPATYPTALPVVTTP